MNIDVLRGKLLKNNYIFINLICVLATKITYANNITIYGMEAAEIYKDKHPNSIYSVQVGSFTAEQNAIKLRQNLQKTSKYKVTIQVKNINNKKVYAVIIGPIKPNNNFSKSNNPYLKQKLITKVSNTKTQSQINITHNDGIKSNLINSLNIYNWRSNSTWYLSIGGGEQFPNNSKTLYVNNGSNFQAPYNIDIYSSSSRSNAGIFSLTGGRVWDNDNYYIKSYSLGVMWQYLFRSNLNGQITQNSDPEFLNYNYQLGTTSNVILGYSKINIFNYKAILPFFNIGLGSAINKSKNYHEEALENVTARISPQYRSKTNTQFAYLLGAGFDIKANENLSISAGYNYLNTGTLSTGYGTSTWSATKLNYGSSTTNEVLITLNYKFNKNSIFN